MTSGAWAGDRKPGKDGTVTVMGNIVDMTKATSTDEA
jgi:hypothetical protein